MNDSHQLGPLQLEVMKILWSFGEGSVSQIHEQLEDRGLALTTVATILMRMSKKRLVNHRKEGRQFIYRASVTEDQIRDSMVGELMDLLFDGNSAALMSHLISADDIERGDLDRVKELIKAKEMRIRNEEKP